MNWILIEVFFGSSYLGFVSRNAGQQYPAKLTFGRTSRKRYLPIFGSWPGETDTRVQVSPIFGPTLMLMWVHQRQQEPKHGHLLTVLLNRSFVCLTNILLITSLISLLSNSLTKVYLACFS